MHTDTTPALLCGNIRIVGGTSKERDQLQRSIEAFSKTKQGRELLAAAQEAARNMQAYCVLVSD